MKLVDRFEQKAAYVHGHKLLVHFVEADLSLVMVRQPWSPGDLARATRVAVRSPSNYTGADYSA
jgi:hypothetical protein